MAYKWLQIRSFPMLLQELCYGTWRVIFTITNHTLDSTLRQLSTSHSHVLFLWYIYIYIWEDVKIHLREIRHEDVKWISALYLWLPMGFFPCIFQQGNCIYFLFLDMCHASHPFNLSGLNILIMLGGNTNYYICHFKTAGDKLDEKCIYSFCWTTWKEEA